MTLDVSYNRFNDESGTELFYSFQKYPRIKHIRIFGNDLGHETAKVLHLYSKLTSLSKLKKKNLFSILACQEVAFREIVRQKKY